MGVVITVRHSPLLCSYALRPQPANDEALLLDVFVQSVVDLVQPTS